MREKILLRRRVAPKWVTLPNRQSFVAKYKRVRRKNLPSNITVKKVRKIWPRQQRTQKGGSIIGTIVKLGAKLGTSGFAEGVFRIEKCCLGQKLIDKGIKQAPTTTNLNNLFGGL